MIRFTGPDKSELACISEGDMWIVQNQSDFYAANGGTTAGALLWDALPYVPKPLDDFPQLDAALAKACEYVAVERPIRERMALYKAQGILADEAELLGKAADAYKRIVSMYLAKAASLYASRRYSASFPSARLASAK